MGLFEEKPKIFRGHLPTFDAAYRQCWKTLSLNLTNNPNHGVDEIH